MDKKWLVPLLAALGLLLVGCAALVFAGARVLISQAASTCSDGNLSLEEKANCGVHAYQLKEKLTSYCSIMKPDQGVRVVAMRFTGDTMTISVRSSVYTRLAANEYQSVTGQQSPTSNIFRHVHTIRFSLDGFTENYAYEGPEGNLIDCWLDTYTITR